MDARSRASSSSFEDEFSDSELFSIDLAGSDDEAFDSDADRMDFDDAISVTSEDSELTEEYSYHLIGSSDTEDGSVEYINDSDSDAVDESLSDDVMDVAVVIDDPVLLRRNEAMREQASALFGKGDAFFNEGDYAAAITEYQAAINLLSLAAPDDRSIKDLRLIDELYNNLATAYLKQGDHQQVINAYQNAYAALLSVQQMVYEQDDLYWLAYYAIGIAKSSRAIDDALMQQFYLHHAVDLLDKMKLTFTLRPDDLRLLAECHIMQFDYRQAVAVLNSIQHKNDDDYRKIAKYNHLLAVEIDPIELPVSDRTIESADLILSALVADAKIEKKTAHDLRAVALHEGSLRNTHADLGLFVRKANANAREAAARPANERPVPAFNGFYGLFAVPSLPASNPNQTVVFENPIWRKKNQ